MNSPNKKIMKLTIISHRLTHINVYANVNMRNFLEFDRAYVAKLSLLIFAVSSNDCDLSWFCQCFSPEHFTFT
jgi:hypothetical protein